MEDQLAKDVETLRDLWLFFDTSRSKEMVQRLTPKNKFQYICLLTETKLDHFPLLLMHMRGITNNRILTICTLQAISQFALLLSTATEDCVWSWPISL